MPYLNGTVTVGTTPTLVCTPSPENDGVLIQNSGTAAVFVGGSNVAATGAHAGISVAAGATVTVPTSGPAASALYAIVATATQTVAYLYPTAD